MNDLLIIENEEEFDIEAELPHLVGKAPETGFQKAKRLAYEAGLLGEDPGERSNGIARLEAWFQKSAGPLLEKLREEWNERDKAQDALDIENYYESRATRFRFNRQIGHARRAAHDHGIGLYTWSWQGKTYRSWLGNEPLATPRQIAAKLLAKYPGIELTIIHSGWSNSQSGGASIIGGIVVPTYQVHLSEKLPNCNLTAERLYLDHGRKLDMEDAMRAERDLLGGSLDRESYADFIARLCREAPVDPDWSDYQAGRWEELSEDGMAFLPFEIDDTRDDPNVAMVLGMLNGHDPLVTTARDVNTGNRIWDEDLSFDLLSAGSDMDNGRDIALLLGLSSHQIEYAFTEVGDQATVGEFFAAVPKKEASARKVAALLEQAESIDF